MTVGIEDVVRVALELPGYTPVRLAAELDVSPSSVARWLVGSSRPRPAVEGRIRELVARYVPAEPSLLAIGHDRDLIEARVAIDTALSSLRETLHRRGRLASRNEALDEIGRLLFAHIMSQSDGGEGISRRSLEAQKMATEAACLSAFVEKVHTRYLPTSLSHQMTREDFSLRLRPQENALANEIVACFEQLHIVEATRNIGGAKGIDILNDVFGKFLANSFADEKELGQYLTPIEVVEFMVRLAVGSLSESERRALGSARTCADFGLVLDPSCGVGSFLTEFTRVAETTLAPTDMDERMAWRRVMCQDVVTGVDKSERMVRFALATMALFRFPAARLHLANSLALQGADADITRSLDDSAGLILTNPPFGATFSGQDLNGYRIAGEWASRPPGSVDSEILFIERYIGWLRPGGQLLAIVPDSILTNKGLFEDLRKAVAPRVDLLSVTSLPSVTFASAGTSTKTSVLQLRRRSQQRTPMTMFAVCNDIGYTVTTRDSRRSKQHKPGGELPSILGSLLGWRDDVPCRSVVGVEQAVRWDAGYHASLPAAVQKRLDNAVEDGVWLRDVAGLSTDRIDPRRCKESTFPYIEISDVDARSLLAMAKQVARENTPSRARKLVQEGDVLVSTVRPERRAIAVVRPEQHGSVATTGFAVIRPTGIHPYILGKLLQTDFVTAQLLRNNVGIAYPAIEESCLPSVLLPISKQKLSLFDAVADKLLDLEGEVREAQSSLASQLEQLAEGWTSVS